jgi:hypothetical protein
VLARGCDGLESSFGSAMTQRARTVRVSGHVEHFICENSIWQRGVARVMQAAQGKSLGPVTKWVATTPIHPAIAGRSRAALDRSEFVTI